MKLQSETDFSFKTEYVSISQLLRLGIFLKSERATSLLVNHSKTFKRLLTTFLQDKEERCTLEKNLYNLYTTQKKETKNEIWF